MLLVRRTNTGFVCLFRKQSHDAPVEKPIKNETSVVDVVLVVFSTEDEVGRTRDLCLVCQTEHKGGVSSTRSFKAGTAS